MEAKMNDKGKLELVAAEVLDVLRKHELFPDAFGMNLTIPRKDFAALAVDYPMHHADIILISSENNGVQWFVQVTPRLAYEDFSSSAIVPSPSDA